MTVPAAAGRTDCDEDRVRPGDAFGKAGGEGQSTGFDIGADQFGKARLVDRHDAFVQAIDLALVLVDAHDRVSEIGEAGT